MTDAALDPTRLAKLKKMGGDALVTALIESFLAESVARRAALEGEDPDAIGHVAHTLVAGAGQLGAIPLAERAKALDEAHRQGDHAVTRQLAAQLLTTYDDALAALRRYRETA
jgi:HPt (histidine-containing phosphotransfer) domain-containing protein